MRTHEADHDDRDETPRMAADRWVPRVREMSTAFCDGQSSMARAAVTRSGSWSVGSGLGALGARRAETQRRRPVRGAGADPRARPAVRADLSRGGLLLGAGWHLLRGLHCLVCSRIRSLLESRLCWPPCPGTCGRIRRAPSRFKRPAISRHSGIEQFSFRCLPMCHTFVMRGGRPHQSSL